MENQTRNPHFDRRTEPERPVKSADKPRLTELITQKFEEQADHYRLAAIDEGRKQVLAKRQTPQETIEPTSTRSVRSPQISSTVTPPTRNNTLKETPGTVESFAPATINESIVVPVEQSPPQSTISEPAVDKLPLPISQESDDLIAGNRTETRDVAAEWLPIEPIVEYETVWIRGAGFDDLSIPQEFDMINEEYADLTVQGSEAIGELDTPFAIKLETLLATDDPASEQVMPANEVVTADKMLELLTIEIESQDDETSEVASKLYDQLLEIINDIVAAQTEDDTVAVMQHTEQLTAVCEELLQTLSHVYTADQLAQIVTILVPIDPMELGLAEELPEDPWEKMREKLDGHPLLVQLTQRAQDLSSHLRLGSLALLGAL